MTTTIYLLSDPDTGAVRYRKPPVLTVVEEVTGSPADGCEVERRWIARLRAEGCNLTNATDGGEGVPGLVRGPISDSHREALRASHLGHKHTPEQKAKISASNTGQKRTPESKARMSAAMRGRKRGPHSPEHIAKIAAANRGKKRSTEFCERLARLNTGKKFSMESRLKMSASADARWRRERAGAQ